MNQITNTARGKQDQPARPPQPESRATLSNGHVARAIQVAPLAVWRTIRRHRLAVKLITPAVAAAACLSLSAGTAEASSPYPAYHSADYSCANAIYDIAPDVVTAFRIDNNVPETVYWRAWLQRQVGSSWVTVPGSYFDWHPFPAAYIDSVRGPVYGALTGSYVPHWPAQTAGTYRITSQFYWSSKGVYSQWEAGPGCPLIPFIIKY